MIQIRCKKCNSRLADVSEDATGRIEIPCNKNCKEGAGSRFINRIAKMEELPRYVPRQKPVASEIVSR